MLNVALIAGVFASILNLGDFLLRPRQKESFQEGLESLVLWLDYERPLRWFSRLEKPSRKHILPLPFLLLIGGFAAMNGSSRLVVGLGFLSFWYGFVLVLCLWFWESRWMNEGFGYLTGDGSVKTFVQRVVWIPIAVILYEIGIFVIDLFLVGQFLVLLFTLWVRINYRRACWIAQGAFPVSLAILSFCALLFLLELPVSIIRWVGWRIVEYSKGAWSAVILLLTTALGIYKFTYGS